ncbi:MAG: ABC transporter permease [Chthoniobacteraceae bacterium]
MKSATSLSAIASVAYKEMLHIWRDRRVLVLIIILPPFFTLLFGYAFAGMSMSKIPTVLDDLDHTADSAKLVEKLKADDTFAWKDVPAPIGNDLLALQTAAIIRIPAGWGDSLKKGHPLPIELVADGSDTNTEPVLEGVLKKTLGDVQVDREQDVIDALPDEVMDLAQKLPESLRNQFTTLLDQWPVHSTILYNPGLRFIDYVTPGIIGLILQLLTVTLMALTITRERDTGTFSQLMVTALRQHEIILGKMLTYLVISIFLILTTIAVAGLNFHVVFHHPGILSLTCFLFLLSSLALGLLLSAISQTQTQAIQFAVFYLLPVFPLSGAFASLDQLPGGVRFVSELFPLTHFCRAFRLINFQSAGWSYLVGDLAFLLVSTAASCVLAALLLKRAQD